MTGNAPLKILNSLPTIFPNGVKKSTGDLAKQLGITKNYRGRTDLALIKDGKATCPYNRILIRRKK